MTRLSAPHTPELDDEKAELVRIEHERKIVELQQLPGTSLGVIRDVTLADGVATPIPHRLGRRVSATNTPPRGALSTGRIEEVRDGSHDPKQYVVLKATGWGASITIDVWVL